MIEFLQRIHPVPIAILKEYAAFCKPISFKRKELITRQGQTERYLYFVLKGYQRSYYINEGKEHVIAFTYPPSFSGMPESFITQTPSKYYLECITDSEMVRIHHHDHMQMLEKYREIETLSRKATELILIGMIDRHYELLAYSIEDRFKAFCERSAHLINKIPHKDIASYLRINPTNFSKLLAKVSI